MTDDELIEMADRDDLWVIWAGGAAMASPGSLRTALQNARRQSAVGEPVTRIVKTPVDDPRIEADQIGRLWARLGI